MSDTSSNRSTSSQLSVGAGFDEKGPFIIRYSGLLGKMQVLRPGYVFPGGFLSGPRVLKEGDVLEDGFLLGKLLVMPRTCDSPYVTPTTSPDASPMLEASGHDGKNMPPTMSLSMSFS